MIITVNGRGDTISLGYEQYKQMKAKIELLEILGEAEKDVRSGRVAPMQETFGALRARGYRVLIVEKQLVFYKVSRNMKTIVVVHAVVESRRDYLNLI